MKQLLLILLIIVASSVASLWFAPQGGMVRFEVPAYGIDLANSLPIAIGLLVLSIVAVALLLRVVGWLFAQIARVFEGAGKPSARRGASIDSRMRQVMGSPFFTTTRLLLAIGAAAIGTFVSVWIINNDVPVKFTFLDLPPYETTSSIAIAGMIILFIGVMLLLRILAWLLDLPGSIQRSTAAELQTRDQIAILEGLMAVAAHDLAAARKYFRVVTKQSHGSPAHLLLGAQIAMLEDNDAALLEHSHAMMSDPASELTGLHLLLDAARADGNAALAVSYAEQIQRRRPGDRWLLGIAVELYAQAGEWAKLKDAARKAAAARVVDSKKAARYGAMADYGLGVQAAQQGELDTAERQLKLALRQDADFLPAAVKLADIAIRKDDSKQATEVLAKAWARNPHPELAERFMQMYRSLPARMQLDRAQRLIRKNPFHPESAAFVAKIALEANSASTARRILGEALKRHNTVRLCQLMLAAQIASEADAETLTYWAHRCTEASPDTTPSLNAYMADGVSAGVGTAPTLAISGQLAAAPQLVALPAPR